MSKHVRVAEPSGKRALRLLRRGLWVCFAVLLVPVVPALAGDAPPEFRVIVNANRPDASAERSFLADVFLKNVTRWPNDEATRPVDQRLDANVRRRFSESVLRRSVAAVKIYWQQRIFSGRGVPPPELDSDEAVVRYVEAHPGAIGYISGAAPHGKTKVLTVTP
jgi:ABC-type phosphate transport system substrate-binding protein